MICEFSLMPLDGKRVIGRPFELTYPCSRHYCAVEIEGKLPAKPINAVAFPAPVFQAQTSCGCYRVSDTRLELQEQTVPTLCILVDRQSDTICIILLEEMILAIAHEQSSSWSPTERM